MEQNKEQTEPFVRIAELPAKIELCMALLECKDIKQFTEEILAVTKNNQNEDSNFRNLHDKFKRWMGGAQPQKEAAEELHKLLVLSIVNKQNAGALMFPRFSTGSPVDIFMAADPAYQARLRETRPPQWAALLDEAARRAAKRSHAFGEGFRTVLIDHELTREDIKRAIATQEFEQAMLYLEPRAVEQWRWLTHRRDGYHTFDDCETALRALVQSAQWQKLVRKGEISGIVTLGGGAPKKDMLILDSFKDSYLNSGRIVNYLLIDSSIPMVTYTQRELENAKDTRYQKFVDFVAVIGDFMKPKPLFRRLREDAGFDVRRGNGRMVVNLLGNTICNIPPEAFATAMGDNLEPGDFLLIGLEFADPKDPSGHSAEVKAVFDKPEMRKLFLPAIRSALDEHHIEIAQDEGAKVIEVVALPDSPQKPNRIRVRGGVAVWAKLDSGNDRKIHLTDSRRYDEASFVSFMRDAGFELWPWQAAGDAPNGGPHASTAAAKAGLYRQMVFRKT